MNRRDVSAMHKMLEGRGAKESAKPPASEPIFAEKHYRPIELARAWGLSVSKVRTMFRHQPGVKYIGQLGSSAKRSYRTMMIPASVAQLVYESLPTLPAAS